jgi:predicted protein tyrosine phosphatase
LRILVSPLSQLPAALALGPARVASLVSPDAEAPDCPGVAPHDRLVLRFNDIAQPAAGLVAPGADHIRALIAFAQAGRTDGLLLIHCWAGISRSPAAAYVIACAHAAEGRERALALALRQASAEATPNPRMVALADDLLGRSGRMVQAIQAIGRGAEAGEGMVFRYLLPLWEKEGPMRSMGG